MRIPSTFVFTHDSIGVGEDGPTHQPIEQLVTLRATPNLDVVRPAGLQRDRARVAPRAAPDRPADRAGALAPGPAGVGPGRGARRRDRARRLRAARDATGGDPRADPDGHRARRSTSPTTPPSCSKPTASGYGSCRCRASTASPSRTRPTATRSCRRPSARASRSRPRARSAGTAGSATTATSSRWRASAPRRPRRSLVRALRLHRRGDRRARPGGARAERGMSATAGQRAARGADRGRAPASGSTRSAAA